VIVGDGPLRERIAARAQSLGLGERLVLAGFRADARRLMAAFDLAVIPSLSEGFSIVAVEAMAAARPVAAYATGGLPEVVADGRTGLLAPERDADALAAAIEALLTDPVRAREMGEAGRERTRECFSLSAMIERIQNLYADLVRSHLVGQPGQGSKRP
jgi:glycosyltransferase involved in cell wall biosynthesis